MRLRNRVIILSSVGVCLIIGASVMAQEATKPLPIKTNTVAKVTSQDVKDEETTVKVKQPVEEPTTTQPQASRPTTTESVPPAADEGVVNQEKTIDEIAATVDYPYQADHKKYIIACAKVYDQRIGFTADGDTSRETAIYNFLHLPVELILGSDNVYTVHGILGVVCTA